MQTLIEREGERDQLGHALRRLQNGEGGVLAIAGEAGIGKTSLLRDAITRVRAMSISVATARASELELKSAHGVTRQLLVPAFTARPAPERARMLAGAAGLASPVLAGVPEVALPDALPGVPDDGAVRHGLFLARR